jgi:hypothetical protein
MLALLLDLLASVLLQRTMPEHEERTSVLGDIAPRR